MKIRKKAAEEIIIALGIALLIAGFILLIAYSKPSMYHKPAPVAPAVHPANLRYTADDSAEFEPKPPRRLSVVRGGIKSLDDLRLDIQHDPILAAFLLLHGFDINTAKFTTLGQDRDVLVSYRPNRNSIVWTKHKVHLTADAVVIVDGNGVMLLAECGNMILPAEPTPSPFPNLTFTPTLFDAPQPFVPETVDMPPPDLVLPPAEFTPPSTTDYPLSGPPIFSPCCGVFAPPVVPTAPTPEPATWMLLLLGLTAVAISRLR